MRETFKGEKRNSEDDHAVSIWTFIDTGVEITQDGREINLLFIPYSKIGCFSIQTFYVERYKQSERYQEKWYGVKFSIVRTGNNNLSDNFFSLSFSDSDYGKYCIERIKEILQAKLS
ncbi:MAG: hypothetical protein ACSI46_04805 [Gloeotrichia echinulata DVL01]|jgi:hypothetical protein|nr:hypothetical protein [Gloeotrichia echinulata DEX184]